MISSEEEQIESRENRYKSLHLCSYLTDNNNFHISGNGDWSTFDSKVVFWFSSPRIDGKPNSRTKKSEKNNYLKQSAVDALLGIANISERVAPYVWDKEHNNLAPDRGFLDSQEKGNKVLLKEVARFIDQYGLPHMLSNYRGPDRYNCLISIGSLQFTGNFEKKFAQIVSKRKSLFERENSEVIRKLYEQEIRRERYYVEGNKVETEANIYAGELKKFAKDFCEFSRASELRSILCEKNNSLQTEIIRLNRVLRNKSSSDPDFKTLEKEIDDLDYELANLRFDKKMLIRGAEKAFSDFSEDERLSLSQGEGYVIPDAHSLYRLSLLFRDAIDLLSAIHGNEDAFKRVLGKCHMELFDVEWIDDKEINEDEKKKIIENVEQRFTIWFESSGYDGANPASNLSGNNYKVELDNITLILNRKEEPWEKEERYGCGCAVYRLCEAGQNTALYEELAKDNLQYFLDCLIQEGLNNNYKNRFADPAGMDPSNPEIKVNDFSSDLVRSLWRVLDYINRKKIPFEVIRCEHCGRLINIANSKGHIRRFCDATCRSEYRKRQAKGGKEQTDVILRRQYFNYVESEEAVHIGMAAHMTTDDNQSLGQDKSLKSSSNLFDFFQPFFVN